MRSFWPNLFPLIALMLLAGCNNQSISGTYTAQQVDGAPMPFVMENEEITLELLGSTLILGPDGNWREFGQMRVLNKATEQAVTVEASTEGTYTVEGNTITFLTTESEVPMADGSTIMQRNAEALPGPYAGTMQGNMLITDQPATEAVPAMRVIYRRQE